MNPKKIIRGVLPKRATHSVEEAYRKSRILALQGRHGFPARTLKIIAVTGTNGKTTTCNYINEMLKSAGYTTAMFTTAVVEMAGEQTVNKIHRTVPLTGELLQFFKQAKANKVDFVVLEVTSHALDQHKLLGVPIEVGVMTNLTQDHLDYHGSMEKYAEAKARLFNDYSHARIAILNHDDEWFGYFEREVIGKLVSYGKSPKSTLKMRYLELGATGSQVELQYRQLPLTLQTKLVGGFNAYNATAAAAVGLSLGLTPKQVSVGIAALQAVPGRMEQITEGQKFGVIVDYAHTPDALENVLTTLQAVTEGRVLIVFGATGDRDKAKRPIMGAVAAKNADRIYLTDDETYSEDPETIRAAVLQGIEDNGGAPNTVVIADRKTAIKTAFAEAKAGDVVLLAGIGHQDYRAMAGVNEPWDERDIARELLREI